MARVLTVQEANAQSVAQAGEKAVASMSGIQGATITGEGPMQIAGRSGYQVRFSFSSAKAKFQAQAAVETGLPSAGQVPTSLIFVTVYDPGRCSASHRDRPDRGVRPGEGQVEINQAANPVEQLPKNACPGRRSVWSQPTMMALAGLRDPAYW
jgi:hypothetical protein